MEHAQTRLEQLAHQAHSQRLMLSIPCALRVAEAMRSVDPECEHAMRYGRDLVILALEHEDGWELRLTIDAAAERAWVMTHGVAPAPVEVEAAPETPVSYSDRSDWQRANRHYRALVSAAGLDADERAELEDLIEARESVTSFRHISPERLRDYVARLHTMTDAERADWARMRIKDVRDAARRARRALANTDEELARAAGAERSYRAG